MNAKVRETAAHLRTPWHPQRQETRRVAVAFMIIALVSLHAFAANSIYKAAGFSLTIRFVI
jgi:hypothetical protein